MTEKQRKYLELAGNPQVVRVDKEGWLLVARKPEDDEVAVAAGIERTIGGKVEFIDEQVWVDLLGREHFGPNEIGYDRFGINDE